MSYGIRPLPLLVGKPPHEHRLPPGTAVVLPQRARFSGPGRRLTSWQKTAYKTGVLTMRVVIIAAAWLLIVCLSSVAQHRATQDDKRAVVKQVKRQRLHSTIVPMIDMDMLFVRAGKHTLIFPIAVRARGKPHPTKHVPFLLAVRHEDNLIVELSHNHYYSPTPLGIKTADVALTAKMLDVTYHNNGEDADDPANVHRKEMRFVANDMPAEESLDFDLNNGRVFVIAAGSESRKTSIRQLPVEMFDTRPLPVDNLGESTRKKIAEVISWWKKIEHDDVKATSHIGSHRRGEARAGPVDQRHSASQAEQHRAHSSVAQDTLLQDQHSVVPQFIEGRRLYQAGRIDFRGPFVVGAGEHVLVFPIVQFDVARMEENIPFLMAVKRQKNEVVISTIDFFVSSPERITIRGEVQIGNMPPFSLDYAVESERGYHTKDGAPTDTYSDYSEEMAFFLELEEVPAEHDFDLQKGRVFLISSDEEAGTTGVRQLQIDMFDPKTVPSSNGEQSIEKKIAGVVCWWKKAKHSEMKGRPKKTVENGLEGKVNGPHGGARNGPGE